MPSSASDLITLSRLLDEALDLEPALAAAWLAALPEEHAHLRSKLAEMLATHLAEGHLAFMAEGPKLAGSIDETVARANELIGPYRLIREIGHGGMGAVWLAERADGTFKRLVALKLPRLAWGAGLAERMARERDIGALLEHPNIARLYDAGVDARGRPYLALEYIDGQPLDAWCEAQALPIRDRLRLFVQIARAVAYAHGRLVVHRDLKPSNVLVTADGKAHLLDFGIAKLLHEAGQVDDQLTAEQGRVLTPHYASPEQLRGETITVASDVYSLGVLLYELLTGRYPYEPERKGLAAIEEAIRNDEAPLASSQARDRATVKALGGEIDAILAKALKREPGQRYATADAFAGDIERYLNGERVIARPDSLGYRLSKSIRRHRVGFAAIGAVLLAVVSGAALAMVQAKRASDAAERARVVKAFVVDVFKVNERGNPANNELRQLPAELLLDRGARLIATKFPGQPDLQAELYGVVGGIFAEMGSSKLAVEYATRQVEALTTIRASDAELADAMLLLADSLTQQDRLADAALRAGRALELSAGQSVLEGRARVMLARVFTAQARYTEARAEIDRFGRDIGALPKPLPSELAVAEAESLWLQVQLRRGGGDSSANRPLWDKAIAAAMEAEGPTSQLAARIRIDYAYRLADIDGAAASEELRKALDAMRAVGGPDDVGAALAQSRVFAEMYEREQVGVKAALAAVTESQRTLAKLGSKLPESVRASVDFDLGWIYRNWGDVERAYSLQSGAAVALRQAAESPFALRIVETSVGMDADEVGRHDEADGLLRRGLELRKVDSAGFPQTVADGYVMVTYNLVHQGRLDEAERQLALVPERPSEAPLRALIRLERGDDRGVIKALADFKPGFRDDPSDLLGAAKCRMGQPREGLSLLDGFIHHRAPLVYEHDAALARARSLAGLCALSLGDRARAIEYAMAARRAFTGQPGVSPFYKASLLELERKLPSR